jgi:uncharacterized Zn finger protein (UPF0148 family)
MGPVVRPDRHRRIRGRGLTMDTITCSRCATVYRRGAPACPTCRTTSRTTTTQTALTTSKAGRTARARTRRYTAARPREETSGETT